MKQGLLIVLSGPSGVGKGTILKELMKDESLKLSYSISWTTRKMREGEVNGENYWFVSKEEFEKAVDDGKMLEHAEFVGNHYGTPADEVKNLEEKEKRIKNILAFLNANSIKNLEEANNICLSHGLDVYKIVKSIQTICFDNAVWAYVAGSAVAIIRKEKEAKNIAKILGEGLQSFCVKGSVADERKVGLGHGNLASMLLDESTKSFCFLAGHESFAAAEGAIGIASTANSVRKKPLNVILNGLGKDAAYIISRINGFTYVETIFDYPSNSLKVLGSTRFSNGPRSKVKVYGADSVSEGVAIMQLENVDVSITGNSTNPTRFQHPVAGTYKKLATESGKKYFSVASGGGTGRTLHPDNVGAGPASYGLTDTMGRMHSNAQFAGSSSVPAHVDMMGFIGMGNNPIVGATVALSVAISQLK